MAGSSYSMGTGFSFPFGCGGMGISKTRTRAATVMARVNKKVSSMASMLAWPINWLMICCMGGCGGLLAESVGCKGCLQLEDQLPGWEDAVTCSARWA